MKLTKSKLKEIIREVISEEKAGEYGMAFAQWVVVKDSNGDMWNYNPKKKELEPFGGARGRKTMKLSQIDDKKFVQSLKKIKL